MCGGSANQRCLPAQRNGDSDRLAAASVPTASALLRPTGPRTVRGASRATPCAVPPLTTTRWLSRGARRRR